jgi:hypothetical protein
LFIDAHIYPVTMMIIVLVTAVAHAAVLGSGGFCYFACGANLVCFKHGFVVRVDFLQLLGYCFALDFGRSAPHSIDVGDPTRQNDDGNGNFVVLWKIWTR